MKQKSRFPFLIAYLKRKTFFFHNLCKNKSIKKSKVELKMSQLHNLHTHTNKCYYIKKKEI